MRKLIELDSFPTVLHVPKAAIGDKLLVGFSDGRVILYRINAMLNDGGCFEITYFNRLSLLFIPFQ